MAEKIRLGVIGANISKGWARRSHVPAVLASPDFELVAVCTTRKESAEESARHYGARLAFHDHRDLIACPDIDAVAVVVRVPSHYQPTKDALNAGKHVFTEWPLGVNLGEAETLADLARVKGLRAVVGLQARAAPGVLYLKDLVANGYVGEVLSCQASQILPGVLQRTSETTWMWDDRLGANYSTIGTGHVADALRFVVGDFSRVAAVVASQARQWLETDTGRTVEVTAPDHAIVSGRLKNGAVASVHIAQVPWAESGFRLQIYGREGMLLAFSETNVMYGEVRIKGTKRGDNRLRTLKIPKRYRWVSEATPPGGPYNVGQMYHRFAQAIRTGENVEPNFDTAVEVHKLVEAIRQSSDQGREVAMD